MSEPIFRKYRKQCVVCGKWFDTSNRKEESCSEECKKERIRITHREYQRKIAENKRQENLKKPQVCLCCGKVFYMTEKRKYCSKNCKSRQAKINSGVIGDDVVSAFSGSDIFESERERRKKRKKVKSIAEMSREAREHGMDYGNYIAWLERNGK